MSGSLGSRSLSPWARSFVARGHLTLTPRAGEFLIRDRCDRNIVCLHCLTVSEHASASAKIAGGVEIQLKLNATGIGQIFAPLLHSSFLAHVLNELVKNFTRQS